MLVTSSNHPAGEIVIEFHVAFGCNFSCDSCSHFSNHLHVGNLTPEETAFQISLWNRRILPTKFCLLGGEPTLNKHLLEVIWAARRGWPDPRLQPRGSPGTQLELTTNGHLLHRYPELPKVLVDTDTKLIFSIHDDSEEYNRQIEPAADLVKEWVLKYGIAVVWRQSVEKWSKRYHGFGSTMMPYDDRNPRLSWERCPAKFCVQLYDGKIWKCPPVAYLPMQAARYNLDPAWHSYLKYNALEQSASDAQVEAFFATEEEHICSMCPSTPELFRKSYPIGRKRDGQQG